MRQQAFADGVVTKIDRLWKEVLRLQSGERWIDPSHFLGEVLGIDPPFMPDPVVDDLPVIAAAFFALLPLIHLDLTRKFDRVTRLAKQRISRSACQFSQGSDMHQPAIVILRDLAVFRADGLILAFNERGDASC